MFNGANQNQIFDLISNRKLSFPKYLDVEAIDLISKLMEKDPSRRLGVGTDKTNDYEALKKHPFFKGINFKNIEETSPPIPAYFYKVMAHQKENKSGKQADITGASEGVRYQSPAKFNELDYDELIE